MRNLSFCNLYPFLYSYGRGATFVFVSIFINHYSNEDFICLDLFGGSGSTMATCQQLKRRCYTMELDPRNCQIIINRMQKCYGIDAEQVF